MNKSELYALRSVVESHVATMGGDITIVPRDCVALAELAKPGDGTLEFAGGHGQTTCILLHKGVRLSTCEMNGDAIAVLRRLIASKATLIEGNIALCVDLLPAQVDLLVIDAEHSSQCAEWYVAHLWPRVRIGGHIWFHDMRYEAWLGGECRYVMKHIPASGLTIVEHNLGNRSGVEGWESIPHQHAGSMACSLVLRRTCYPISEAIDVD